DIVFKVLGSFTDEQLLEMMDWYSLNGAVAYKYIGIERFYLISDHIRTDASNRFLRLKEAADTRLQAAGGTYAATFIKEFEENGLNQFMASRFLEAAAKGIAAHAIPSDIILARQWLPLRDEETSLAALEIISKFGDSSDVEM